LGGRAMEIVYSRDALADYLHRNRAEGEIFLDRFLEDSIEIDVDALCDGDDVWVGGIMQHVEEAGIHSGDSACVLPPHSLGAVLPFDRFAGADALLGPEMRSTGEVMGIAEDFPTAFAKAQAAAGAVLPDRGTVFISVTDRDKSAAGGAAILLHGLGFRILATA